MPELDLKRAQDADIALRDAIGDAHRALKDLKAERKAVADERAAVQKLIDSMPDRAAQAVTEAMGEAIKAGLEGYEHAIKHAIDAAQAAVDKRFDKLASIMLGEDKSSKETLAAQVRRWREGLSDR